MYALHRSPEIASEYCRDSRPDAPPVSRDQVVDLLLEPEAGHWQSIVLRALEREWNNSPGVVGAERTGGTKVPGSSRHTENRVRP